VRKEWEVEKSYESSWEECLRWEERGEYSDLCCRDFLAVIFVDFVDFAVEFEANKYC
jgi:hypothetical protein